MVDIVPQQQLPEIFNKLHHRSSTTTNKRNSTSINNDKSNSPQIPIGELGRKAEQILGFPTAVVDYDRQDSIDYSSRNLPRLSTPKKKIRIDSNQEISPITTINLKNENFQILSKLVPLIFKVVEPFKFEKLTKLNENENDDHIIPNENQTFVKKIEPQFFDSDAQVSTHSDTENGLDINSSDQGVSLIDFIAPKNDRPEQILSIQTLKRKQEIIKSFSSSVNTPINKKQPALNITIPTYLFHDQSMKTNEVLDDQLTSKRPIDNLIKSEQNSDLIDDFYFFSQTKKSKTFHTGKQESISNSPTIKDEFVQSNTNKNFNQTLNGQIKTLKPTANVRPLLQTTPIENLSSNNLNNVSDRLSSRTIYSHNLSSMTTKELNNLAREKKKQADSEKRTFDDVKKSITLYLESVCYFIRCAMDEHILEQRSSLLSATLNMLNHLINNYKKMFCIPTVQSNEILNDIQQKFLLINYWLQSLIYQLKYNMDLTSIDNFAHQVNEYINHSKSPSDVNNNFLYEFSKHMLNAYYSNYYWNKAERLTHEESLKKFVEQLIRQNQNRSLRRDDSTIEFLLYIFEGIDLLRKNIV